ncbi:hypothetical protein EYC80_004833 [Monilinia laxa]|uniref:Uncharacterized protein n=1 Tax=Monilinia laxa TaxID=61186 RepID=A0A5N6KI89_MONLA|nr:hypothetical protein EYC80_004833 [Monilinia laxa]
MFKAVPPRYLSISFCQYQQLSFEHFIFLHRSRAFCYKIRFHSLVLCISLFERITIPYIDLIQKISNPLKISTTSIFKYITIFSTLPTIIQTHRFVTSGTIKIFNQHTHSSCFLKPQS